MVSPSLHDKAREPLSPPPLCVYIHIVNVSKYSDQTPWNPKEA